jgi:hypothetical protein
MTTRTTSDKTARATVVTWRRLLRRRFTKRLDAVRIEGKVVEEWKLLQRLGELRMLVGDVLLDEGSRLEQLLAGLAAVLALVLLLDVGLNCTLELTVVVICYQVMITRM